MQVPLPPFGEDLAKIYSEIEQVLGKSFEIPPVVQLPSTAVEAEGQDKRPKRRTASKADQSKVIEFYLPHEASEVRERAPELPEEAPPSKEQREKQFERVGKGQSSYRKLKNPFQLEDSIDVHFLLNHKYKIIQFGCAGSVSQKLSADEGMDRRNTNPIYNCEPFNAQFDTLADRESEANADMRLYLTDAKRRRGLVLLKCVALDQTRDLFVELMGYPKTFDIVFEPAEPARGVRYCDFLVIGSILSSVEMVSKSLKSGQVIRSTLQAYTSLVRTALTKPNGVHFVCDSLGLSFVNVTHQLMRAISNALKFPQNYKYRIFLDFFIRKQICLDDILEEFEAEIADLVDNGGWLCTAILRYRELLSALDLNSYIGLMYDEISVVSKHIADDQRQSELVNVARCYCNYGALFAVKFEFTDTGDLFARITRVAEASGSLPIFPIFNMFDLNLEDLPRDQQKHALKFIPF